MVARSFAVLADQAGSALAAASMARAASSAPRLGTAATSPPVAGSVTERVLEEVTHSPSIRAAVGNFLAIMVIFNLRQRIVMRRSCDTRIPQVIKRCDDPLEVAALGMFQAKKDLLEGRAECAANDLRALEAIEGVDPGGGQRRRFHRLGVALDGRPRIDPVSEAVAHAG